MSAQAACAHLVEKVKSSNLNYVVRETPYSVFITLRKSFAKTTEKISEHLEEEKNENNLQNDDHDELQSKYEDMLTKYSKLSTDFESFMNKMRKENNEKNILLDKILKKC